MTNQRIHGIEPAQADERLYGLFERVKGRFGMVPNLTKVMARSPITLQAFLALGDLQAEGRLSRDLQTKIAVTVAQANACDYCLSAHTAIGKLSQIDDNELALNRYGDSEDRRIQTALHFVRHVVRSKGGIAEGDLDTVRRAGYSDEEIIEMLLNVAVNTLTNYVNRVAGTAVDFPLISAREERVSS